MQALRAREADVVLAGGVNALITPLVTVGFDEVGGVLASDGRIKSFSQDADGYARSEGGGMLVLKRVADARRDGDEILAVIAGSAINHDGRSNGLLAPNPDAQAEVLRKAYKDAGINPRDVDYIEAHGTGTILGDPIEADALGRVVGTSRRQAGAAGRGEIQCGTPGVGAGAASLAEDDAGAAQRQVAALDQLHRAQPLYRLRGGAAEGRRHRHRLAPLQRHAIAGVSGFGFGGANAHLVLREVLPSISLSRNRNRSPSSPSRLPRRPPNTSAVSGWTSTASSSTTTMTTEPTRPPATTPTSANLELPGLTDEAKRLLEVAREELEASEQPTPVVPLAVSAFLTSRKKQAAAELADWIDSPEGRASALESIGRSLSRRNHGRSRAVVLAHDHDEAIKGLRTGRGKQNLTVFSADGPVTNGPVGAGRFRRPAPQDG